MIGDGDSSVENGVLAEQPINLRTRKPQPRRPKSGSRLKVRASRILRGSSFAGVPSHVCLLIMEAAKGHLLSEPVQGQNTKYASMIISENIEEELHRQGASSDTIDYLKEDDEMTHLPIRLMALDGSIRPYALRFISHLLRAYTSDQGIWFHAALLLDRFAASNSFRLEQLPLTCACSASLALKCASERPFADQSSRWMILINDFAEWLESTQNCVTSEVSNEALALHERTVFEALDWHVGAACVEQWYLAYFTRFECMVGQEFQAPILQMRATFRRFARTVVLCFPASPMLSHGKLATGLFSLCFVYGGLLPKASLKPSTMSAAEWGALFAATPPGQLPPYSCPQAETMRLMDVLCLVVKEEPDDIRAWSGHALEALGESFRQLSTFQVEGGGQ